MRSRRASARRMLASVLSGALIATAALVGVAAPAQAAEAATVTAPAAPRAGGDLALTGSGFDPSGNGIYLSVRSNATSDDSYTVWIDDTNTAGTIPGLGATAPMTADGSFTVTVPVPAYSEAGYSIVTRGAHGEQNATNATTTPIVYEAAPAAATTTALAVSPSASVTEGTPISVTATVSPAAEGTVTLSAGATTLQTVTVAAGVAAFAALTPAVGTHDLTAVFSPADSAAFLPSTGAVSVVVAEAESNVPEDPEFEPALSVFLADGTTPYTGQPVYTDDVLVVKGTGFDPEANVGGRGVPIPNTLPQGTYVVLGSFLDQWQPSSGAAGSARKVVSQKWALAEGVLEQVPPNFQGAIRAQWADIAADGSFTTTLTAKDFADGLPDGAWGVYTYGAGGVSNAAQELSVEVDYVGDRAVDLPAIEVFLADGTTPYTDQEVAEGDVLVVKGTGFDPAANVGGMGVPIPSDLPQGTFVVFGSFADEWQPSAGVASSQRTMNAESRVWALAEDVLDQVPAQFRETIEAAWAPISDDGSFEAHVTLKTPVAPLTDGTWGIYTYPGGVGTPANPAQELSVPVVYTVEDATPEEPAGPQVTVTPTALDPNVENVLTIAGTGFTGPGAAQGAYVVFGEASIWDGSGPLVADGWVALGWVMPNQITAGAFTTTLTVPAGTLDPAKEYVVATSAAHGLSVTDRTLDTFTPIEVTAPETAEPAIFLSLPSVQQGESLTVRGTGFPAGQLVSVTVNSDPITLGSATTNASGAFAVTGTIPAGFAAGAHTVTVVSGDIVLSAALTVTAAPVAEVEEPEAPTCVAQAVSGATLRWSVKSSFRDYINGPIANGSYSINWGSGSGAYNTDENRGRVSFGGSASFTGHSGLLALTLSNPRIQVYSSGSAALIANVSSKGYADNPAVNANGVVIANLSLPRASVSGSTISWNGASATLTAAGARAFAGFYEAGAALDPVSFSFPLGAEVPCDTSTSGELAASGGESPYGVVWMGLGMLVLGAGLVALRRRTVRA